MPNSKIYDYVGVGGGTAGLVVAARLSEDPKITVCILEAGENHLEDPQISIPALWPGLMGSDVDWQFRTSPQAGLDGKPVKLAAGRLLGGSSGLNGQAFIAPSKSGIDAWATLGYSDWTWESMKPYYKRFHTLHVPDEETREHLGIDWINEEATGSSGPIQASFAGVIQDPVGKAWVDTFKALGSATSADPFSGTSLGGYASAYACDPKTKTRSYSASAYFETAASRPNLTLITGATATRILFQQDTDRLTAQAVEYSHHGEPARVLAAKEVVLAAGAIQSPKILELSGIGNSKTLKQHSIDVLFDNPNVGENLQDHVLSGFSVEAEDHVLTGDALMRQEPQAIKEAMEMYSTHKAGPLAAGGVASHAFMPTPNHEFPHSLFEETLTKGTLEKDRRYQHVVHDILTSPSESSAALQMFCVQVDCHSDTSKFVEPSALKPGKFITLAANQCHPFSRGNTHVMSSNPDVKPCVDPRYLSHPVDIEILAKHFVYLEQLAKTRPLADHIKTAGLRNHPSAYVADIDAAKAYLRGAGMSNWHVCGTCAMMPQDKGGVVDGDLIVHGTSNVRIVDASVFPLIPRGNIMSTVYAVAERAAHIIAGSK